MRAVQFSLLTACCAIFAAPAATTLPYTFIEGQFTETAQPDGNSVIYDDGEQIIVIDSGRHTEHTQKLTEFASSRQRPINAVINTHWHLDHSTGNVMIRRLYPATDVYSSNAVVAALNGFLIRNLNKNRELINDPVVSELRKKDILLYLDAIDHQQHLIPNKVVTGSTIIQLKDRQLHLQLASRAVSEGDIWIHDKQANTVIVGDLVVVPLPFFDTACTSGWKAALNTIEHTSFQTLIPGHGKPMSHQEFSVYHQAFDAFTDCASSTATTQACVDVWLNKAAPFVATYPNVNTVKEYLEYYVDTILRDKNKQNEFCLK